MHENIKDVFNEGHFWKDDFKNPSQNMSKYKLQPNSKYMLVVVPG